MKSIIFSIEEAQSILEIRKSRFAKVITEKFYYKLDEKTRELPYVEKYINTFINENSKYKVGDILYVREPIKVMSPPIETCRKMAFKYLADNLYADIVLDKEFDISKKWIQRCQGVPNGCIKEMARIFLKVTNVRVETLQDMKIEDFLDEGVMDKEFVVFSPDNGLNEYYKYLKDKWVNHWDSTAKDGYKWENNPYVFVYEFERVEK